MRVRTRPSSRRWALALAATVALAVGAGLVVRPTGSGDAGGTEPIPLDPAARAAATERWLDETIAFRPAAPPTDWELSMVSATEDRPAGADRWQLFGQDIDVPEGAVLVGTSAEPTRPYSRDATHTVRGLPGWVEAAAVPTLPDDALVARWVDGYTVHQALAVGVAEDEMMRKLDSLVSRPDSASGFDAPSDGSLAEVARATSEAAPRSFVRYRTPSDEIVLFSSPTDSHGGLLHLLAGRPVPGGWVLPGGTSHSQDGPTATLVRDDGWTVTAASGGSLSTDDLVALVHDVELVTRREALTIGVMQPATLTTDVGDWNVRVHGTDERDMAVCVTPASGAEMCALANAFLTEPFTAASFPISGEWLVVAVSQAPTRSIVTPHVPPDATSSTDVEELRGELGRAGSRVVEVFTVPADVEAVDVRGWHERGPTVTYRRATG